ncbi:MAG: YceI family protein [Planctomycetota bacterium]
MQRTLTIAPLVLATTLLGACDNPADSTFSTEATDAKEVTPADIPENAVTIELTGDNTTVEWTGSKPTGSSHDGGFKTLDGTAIVVDDALTSIEATIEIGSMWSDNNDLTTHLLNEDFFDSTAFPESKFVSTEIREATDADKTEEAAEATHFITGNFTLRGVTKSIAFPVTVSADDTAYKLDAEFDINRGQFGMDYGLADAAIRDEVVIRLKFDLAKP